MAWITARELANSAMYTGDKLRLAYAVDDSGARTKITSVSAGHSDVYVGLYGSDTLTRMSDDDPIWIDDLGHKNS